MEFGVLQRREDSQLHKRAVSRRESLLILPSSFYLTNTPFRTAEFSNVDQLTSTASSILSDVYLAYRHALIEFSVSYFVDFHDFVNQTPQTTSHRALLLKVLRISLRFSRCFVTELFVTEKNEYRFPKLSITICLLDKSSVTAIVFLFNTFWCKYTVVKQRGEGRSIVVLLPLRTYVHIPCTVLLYT